MAVSMPLMVERNRIMPINWYYGLDELLRALHGYVKKTSRRITIEYALMSGFNDAEEDARHWSGS